MVVHTTDLAKQLDELFALQIVDTLYNSWQQKTTP
jgi:hypothetical protein